MIIEVKNHAEKLDNHNNQLVRYFHVTDSRFAILTNGIEYRFFQTLKRKTRWINSIFNYQSENIKDRDIKELARFAKDFS